MKLFANFVLISQLILVNSNSNTLNGIGESDLRLYTCSSEKNGESFENFGDFWNPEGYLVAKSDRKVMAYVNFRLNQVPDLNCSSLSSRKDIFSNISMNNLVFYPNGYIKADNFYIAPENFCIKNLKNESIEISYCEPNCDEKDIVCLPKCCPIHKMMVKSNGQLSPCQVSHDLSQIWTPKVHTSFHENESADKLINFYSASPGKRNFLLKEFTPFKFNQSHGFEFKVLSNGKVAIKNSHEGPCRYHDQDSQNDFCLDGLAINSNGYLQYEIGHEGYNVMIFIPKMKQENKTIIPPPQNEVYKFNGLYGTLALISAILLLCTLVVYLLLWNTHTIHSWCIFSLTTSMLSLYIWLSAVHFTSLLWKSEALGSTGCYLIGIFFHFSFLSTFCWLTVICFDLFYTFKSLTTSQDSKKYKQFALYSIFAWGLPIIVLIISITLDQVYSSDATLYKLYGECIDPVQVENFRSKYLPGYGKTSCLVQSSTQGLYLYNPAGFLLIINLLFFIGTTYNIYKLKRSTSLATQNLQNRGRNECVLYIKLFFVMGITWIAEIVSWTNSGTSETWHWLIFDIVNLLQGFAIFMIFIFKKEILTALQKKYRFFQTLTTNESKDQSNVVSSKTKDMNLSKVGE